MPTGYTAKLMADGQTFPEFAMDCARAFGACIMMRDDPSGVPIPDKFEPSDYNLQRLAEAKAKLESLEAMNESDREKYGLGLKVTSLASSQKYLEEDRLENQRLESMAAEVSAWTPPTADHVELKKFMLRQIEISMNNLSYSEECIAAVNAKSHEAFYLEAVLQAQRDIAYHTEEHAKEIERTNGRTEWVQQLRASLNRKH